MARKDLSVESMVSISTPWVDPTGDRPVLQGYPALAGNIFMLDRAHQGLLKTQKKQGMNTDELNRLTDEATALDAVHDRKARAVFALIEGLFDREDDAKKREQWATLHEALFPDGLSFNRSSYLSEAGNVQLVRARITPKMQQRLDQTIVDGESLGQTVADWFDAGEALGEVFTRRARLKNADDAELVSANEVLAARNYWIRAVNNFIDTLDLVAVPAETRDRLLTPLFEAEKAAARPAPQSTQASPEPV